VLPAADSDEPGRPQLVDRLQFEALISDTSASLIVASPHGVKEAISAALERVRRFFQADRCSLMSVSADQRTLNVFEASYASGLVQVPTEVNLAERFPWCSHRILEGAPTVIRRMTDLPPEAAVDRASWASLRTRSSLTVPIFTGATVSHLIAMATVSDERDWPVEYVPRLRVLGEMMANAFLRAEAFESLQLAHDEVKRLRDRLEGENVYLRKEAVSVPDSDLVAGRSPAIQRVLALAAQVATTTSTVLLAGETGTGKERFAGYIHQASPRRDRHMVRVNCSAIPSALIESELFGREKGAYTGALSRQIGRFELAHGSTIFLDEIGDLPLDMQVKLLHVLQERTIERLGSPTPIKVDVRIIAATNRDLDAAVRAGTFRSDLYYRLNVFPIVVPPLRERREDIPALVETLVEELSASMRKRFRAVDAASLEALSGYGWPGNVRELRNVLERAMILASGPTLTVDPPRSTGNASSTAKTPAAGSDLRTVEREHIIRVLEQTGWRIRGKNAAAAVLGLKPTTLEGRMSKLAIHRPASDT
jgi:formate hydrogenlyase transcriptional activator